MGLFLGFLGSPDEEIGPGVMTFRKPDVVRIADNYIVDSQYNDEVGYNHTWKTGAPVPKCQDLVDVPFQSRRKAFLLENLALLYLGDWCDW